MSKACYFCHKKLSRGNVVQRRGLAKKSGGIGKKTTSITKRTFKPNLQKIRIIEQGKVKEVLACAKCIKKGNFTKFVAKAKVSA